MVTRWIRAHKKVSTSDRRQDHRSPHAHLLPKAHGYTRGGFLSVKTRLGDIPGCYQRLFGFRSLHLASWIGFPRVGLHFRSVLWIRRVSDIAHSSRRAFGQSRLHASVLTPFVARASFVVRFPHETSVLRAWSVERRDTHVFVLRFRACICFVSSHLCLPRSV